jgi:hypothetical protein
MIFRALKNKGFKITEENILMIGKECYDGNQKIRTFPE